MERNHDGGNGRVLPSAHLRADLTDPELETRLYCIQQAGFSGTGWSSHHRNPAGERAGEFLDAFSGLGARWIDRVSSRPAAVDQLLPRVELYLVHDHRGLNRVRLGDDQQPIDELGDWS